MKKVGFFTFALMIICFAAVSAGAGALPAFPGAFGADGQTSAQTAGTTATAGNITGGIVLELFKDIDSGQDIKGAATASMDGPGPYAVTAPDIAGYTYQGYKFNGGDLINANPAAAPDSGTVAFYYKIIPTTTATTTATTSATVKTTVNATTKTTAKTTAKTTVKTTAATKSAAATAAAIKSTTAAAPATTDTTTGYITGAAPPTSTASSADTTDTAATTAAVTVTAPAPAVSGGVSIPLFIICVIAALALGAGGMYLVFKWIYR